jgi:hypothetical protein
MSLIGEPAGLLEDIFSFMLTLNLGTFCWPLRAGWRSLFTGYKHKKENQ